MFLFLGTAAKETILIETANSDTVEVVIVHFHGQSKTVFSEAIHQGGGEGGGGRRVKQTEKQMLPPICYNY